MKKIKFTDKVLNCENEVLASNVGEKVFTACKDIKMVNNAIRWCNTHNVGDVFDCDLYRMEIIKA
jgi:hypothetical protein